MPTSSAMQAEHESLAQIELAFSLLVRLGSRPKMRESLAKATGVSLDRAALTVLSSLSEHGASRLSELSPRIGVDTSTACRQVQNLERLGLVDRVADPADWRASRLRLSVEGERVFTRVRAARRNAVAAVIAGWPAEQRSWFATQLLELVQGLETAVANGTFGASPAGTDTESPATKEVTTGERV